MAAPLIVEVLRDQLAQTLLWYRHQRPAYQWGVVFHRRNERGHFRFGAVTPAGESLLVTEPLVARLCERPCWIDGVVPVRFEIRQLDDGDSPPDAETAVPAGRARLVDALAVYWAPEASVEVPARRPLPAASVLTPAAMPSELFVLTRERPEGWPP